MKVLSPNKKVNIKKAFFSFLIAFAIFYLLLSRINIKNVVEIIFNSDVKLLVFAFIIYYIGFIFKSLRWKILMGNIGLEVKLTKVYEIYFLGQFINSILPGRIGDFYRAHLIKKDYGLARSKVIGTIFIEKLVDLSFILIFLVISAFLVFGADIPKNFREIIIILGIFLVVIAIISVSLISNLSIKWISLFPKSLQLMHKNFIEAYSESLNFKTFPLLLLCTLSLWFFEFLMFFLVTISIGLKLKISLVLMVILIANLLLALPLTPSGIGIVETGIAGALILVGVKNDIAVSVALLNNVVGYWNQVIFGFVAYLRYNR